MRTNLFSMVQLLGRNWRQDLADVVSLATRSVIIAAPYIKYDEAVWLCDQIRPGLEITTLANINADAVSSAALDIAALQYLAEATPSSGLIALPNLHAKVFIADEAAAIVTSGNLTRAALDRNIEFGVVLHEPSLVQNVRSEMLSYARLGTPVAGEAIADLVPLEIDLRQARAKVIDSATQVARQTFDEVMRRAHPVLASIQVGNRTANSVFGEAILLVLADGLPRPTREIARQVSTLLPALCNDDEELVINGQQFGKAWKHRLRNAQQHLKSAGRVTYDSNSRSWAIAQPSS